jgi:hypothetical protein
MLATEAHMTDVSAEDMLDRLRHSMYRLLQWAEEYQPRTRYERERYDADLDEAEDVLDATAAWLASHGRGGCPR